MKWGKTLQICVKKFRPNFADPENFLMNLSGRMDKAMRLVYDMRQTYVDIKGDKKSNEKID